MATARKRISRTVPKKRTSKVVPKKRLTKKDMVGYLEKLLARKLQIKAQLFEIENTIKAFTLRMETAPKSVSKKKHLHESDEIYKNKMELLETREAELRVELFEISALTRSIPIRRLRPEIDGTKVRDLLLDAKLYTVTDRLNETLNAASCSVGCTVCITSCTVCVTSCTSCVARVDGCSSSCAIAHGTASGYTHQKFDYPSYIIPNTINQTENLKYIPENELIEIVAKKYASIENIEIDWS